ncbi:hypothetical protein F5B22DRAFT_598928 [Xylaria bambusicola]|uniref:uncharacterized protein n=1 Tax=Xylaria bambusicola TaxID=326684 RepID=UPI002007920E|nr:uncharacterized protein F5B22DRAFT_598928 [Xylaria bambusicola]KAI0520940.1 hypothetical protein F5B22DRAFT_598928 [Xylaria bambusicola]
MSRAPVAGLHIRPYLRYLASDLHRRLRAGYTLGQATALWLTWSFPQKVAAANTYVFTPVQTLSPAQQTSVNQEGGDFDFINWVNRGMTIRGGNSVYACLANLTAALELVGQLNQAEYNGAAGALSLLPTAGALLGAPTREMWILYKLVPISGILSMFLSLGGSITPSNVGDYDPNKPFSFGGFVPTIPVEASRRPKSRTTSHINEGEANIYKRDEELMVEDDINKFAREIKERAEDDGGGDIFLRVWFAMGIQITLIAALLVPMYYAQRGAVITWWCRVWGWMWFWYFLVTVVAIFDNLVAAPFTKSWTVRISRSPTGIILDETAPKIYNNPQYPNALAFIKAGPVMNQRVRIAANTGASYPRTCFYAVISVKRISTVHAIAQVVAKLSSVAVFAFGTALFASATLVSISIALMVLSVILAAGVGGRVLAMWVVATISSQNRPIIHKMVRSEEEAARYFQALAEIDVQMEISGHVIVNGTIVKSRHVWFSPETYIGLLAKPFDVVSMAEKNSRGSATSAYHPVAQNFLAPMMDDEMQYSQLSAPQRRPGPSSGQDWIP